jgi:hypothetical protein
MEEEANPFKGAKLHGTQYFATLIKNLMMELQKMVPHVGEGIIVINIGETSKDRQNFVQKTISDILGFEQSSLPGANIVLFTDKQGVIHSRLVWENDSTGCFLSFQEFDYQQFAENLTKAIKD